MKKRKKKVTKLWKKAYRRNSLGFGITDSIILGT